MLPLLAPILKDVRYDWANHPSELLRLALPLLALIVPLLIMPAGDRIQAFTKLLISGVVYLIVLLLVQGRQTGSENSQGQPENAWGQFVRVLLGG